MALIIHARLKSAVRSCLTLGRCVAVHLFHRAEGDTGATMNMFIIGVHNAHGDLQLDALNDVASLARRRPWGSKLFICGDLNCDQLPDHAADP